MKKVKAPSETKPATFWFVAAGTGGHIFPGLTLANEIRTLLPEGQFLFFGTRDRLEAKIIPAHSHRIYFLNAGQWKGRGLMGRVRGMFSMLAGFFQVAAKLLGGRPNCLISVGGYVSVPTALACRLFGVPLFLVEPNIRAGLANKMLSRLARAAFCTPGADAVKLFKCPVHELGNPIRRDIERSAVHPQVQKILVLGGSQGALGLCRASLEALQALKQAGFTGTLLLQSGEKNFQQSLDWQREFEVDEISKVAPFINKVSQALKEHDFVIARAGAMTLAELSIAGLPTVLVPFPFAADDHQRVNAKMLQDAGAVRVVEEQSPDFTANLISTLHELCMREGAYEKRQALGNEFVKWGRPNAGADIAKQVLSLCNLRV